MSVPDWILKGALATQEKAHSDFIKTKPELRPNDAGLTLTVLGCGTIGTAILTGLMDNNARQSSPHAPADLPTPARIPSRFNACVRSRTSAQRVESELGKANVSIYENDNLPAVQDADVVLLSCEAPALPLMLSAAGIRHALAGKLLISVVGGVSESQLHDIIYSDDDGDGDGDDYAEAEKKSGKCTIVRAVPNLAAAVRESMTTLAISDPPLPEDWEELVTYIFTKVGKVVRLPASAMDAATALCGAGPAFCALMAESMAAGAIAQGVPREAACTMTAQVLRGTSSLLQGGMHPAIVRDSVSTPDGAAIGGLLVLEEGGIRGTIARAIREATNRASQKVNGMRNCNRGREP